MVRMVISVLVLAASLAPAQDEEVTVVLKDGTRVTGSIYSWNRKKGEMKIKPKKGRTVTLKSKEIDRILFGGSSEQEDPAGPAPDNEALSEKGNWRITIKPKKKPTKAQADQLKELLAGRVKHLWKLIGGIVTEEDETTYQFNGILRADAEALAAWLTGDGTVRLYKERELAEDERGKYSYPNAPKGARWLWGYPNVATYQKAILVELKEIKLPAAPKREFVEGDKKLKWSYSDAARKVYNDWCRKNSGATLVISVSGLYFTFMERPSSVGDRPLELFTFTQGNAKFIEATKLHLQSPPVPLTYKIEKAR